MNWLKVSEELPQSNTLVLICWIVEYHNEIGGTDTYKKANGPRLVRYRDDTKWAGFMTPTYWMYPPSLPIPD